MSQFTPLFRDLQQFGVCLAYAGALGQYLRWSSEISNVENLDILLCLAPSPQKGPGSRIANLFQQVVTDLFMQNTLFSTKQTNPLVLPAFNMYYMVTMAQE